MTKEPSVVASVCIPTYRRPETLKLLLEALGAQSFPSFSEKPLWDVCLIDNDPAGSARKLYETVKDAFPVPLHYQAEPNIGLCFVRNRAIDFALDHADFLVFIDDDETPCPQWLDALLTMQKNKAASCVYAPVLARLPDRAPYWLAAGKYLDSPPFEDGAALPWAGTGNVLLATSFLRQSGLRFDLRFNLIGGEDAHFFDVAQRLHGLTIIGCRTAVAYENVPQDRLALSWHLRRRFRMGGSLALCEKGHTLRLSLRALKGLGWIIRGLATMITALWRGSLALVDGLLKGTFGLGMMAGLLGVLHREYAPNNPKE